MMAWPPASLRQRQLDLRDTRTALRELPEDAPDFTGACLARYLAIRSAGYLEAVRDDVADEHVAIKSTAEVARRVRKHLRQGQGVTPAQLLDFVGSFDPGWYAELEEILNDDDQALRSSLGALVAARKKIAHGDGESVTVGKALRWSDTAEGLGNWLIRRFDPSARADEPLRRK